MQNPVSAFLQRVADRIVEGEVDCVVDRMILPLPVHVGQEVLLLSVAPKAKNYLLGQHAFLKSVEATSIRSQCLTYEEDGDRRVNTVVAWRIYSEDGQEIGLNQMRFFCTLLSDAIAINMVEHLAASGTSMDPIAVVKNI